jgi:anti-anti-sigma factor
MKPEGEGSGSGTVFEASVRRASDSGAVVLRVSGDLDDAAAEKLADLLDRHLDDAPAALVLDLTATSTLGTAVAETFTERARRAGEANIGFYLVAGPGPVRRELLASSGHDFLDISATVGSALRAVM